MFSVLAAAPASLCHSNDADSAVVVTFPHRHANIPRSLWPAVSLSPTISPSLANKLPACVGFRQRGFHAGPALNYHVRAFKLISLIQPK